MSRYHLMARFPSFCEVQHVKKICMDEHIKKMGWLIMSKKCGSSYQKSNNVGWNEIGN